VPGQQGGRGDDPVPTQRAGEQPGQRGQDRPVRPGRVRPAHLMAQHRDVVTQDEDLDMLGRGCAGEQSEPADQPDRDQIPQSEQHGPRSCHDHAVSLKPQVTTRVTSFGTAQVASHRLSRLNAAPSTVSPYGIPAPASSW
jgi:hypothetical protein